MMRLDEFALNMKHRTRVFLLKIGNWWQFTWFKTAVVIAVVGALAISQWLQNHENRRLARYKAMPMSYSENRRELPMLAPPRGISLFVVPPSLYPFEIIDDGELSSYSNVGFILNPSYAREHGVSTAVVASKRRICIGYVERYAPIAIEEMKKFGVPASITLAQGLLESNAGHSKLAMQNRNHFGIKCFMKNCSPGHCTNYADDSRDDFFRKFNNVWEGFRAHSLFLKKPWYEPLYKLSSIDYKGWAKGLSDAGYATDKRYDLKLIRLIEDLRLYQYDEDVRIPIEEVQDTLLIVTEALDSIVIGE